MGEVATIADAQVSLLLAREAIAEPAIDTFHASAHSAIACPSTEKRTALYERFRTKITTNPALDRTLVSFQANKRVRFYGWFKYKEGFSESLVTYLLRHLKPQPGMLLDPFAGAGAALFAASSLGWQTAGVELLPVGVHAMQSRFVANRIDPTIFRTYVDEVLGKDFAEHFDQRYSLNHIAITRGAFPDLEEKQLIGYLSYCHQAVSDDNVRAILLYAAFCILEDISYTRKDGQYLRWDMRSGRSQGKKPFNKGYIPLFREAITDKLRRITADLEGGPVQQHLFNGVSLPETISYEPKLHEGSCLEILPQMEASTVDFVLTSPPYANRYDYTRTYALELVYLGCGEEKVKNLRQAMLSCTVENKDKRSQLEQYYASLGLESRFHMIDKTFQQQDALQEVIDILEKYRRDGKLNNDNVVRMVRNYFYEMCFVIYELARLLKNGGVIAMVNDNVRYAGEEVPVDLILSDIAESFGLKTRHIWTLGRGKGNSSQQMGNHGRSELRKCVYVWEK